jgi:hypothetical protein
MHFFFFFNLGLSHEVQEDFSGKLPKKKNYVYTCMHTGRERDRERKAYQLSSFSYA